MGRRANGSLAFESRNMPCRTSARRCARARLLTFLISTVLAGFPNSTRAQEVRPDSSSILTAEDSFGPHGSLLRRIESFEDVWRREWQTAQFAIHGRLDLTDILLDNRAHAGRVRRYWSLRCLMATPGRAISKIVPPIVQRPVVTKPDRGSVCPNWFPPDDRVVQDESQSIDLALLITQREPIYAARDTLITEIEKLFAANPRDSWVAGQRVRFVYDQNDTARTRAAAAECLGNSATCTRLLGLAYFQASNILAADSAFRLADSIADATRDRSTDCNNAENRMLFNVYDRAYLDDQSCVRQQELVSNAWWLADPLWSVAGNERYVAHQARSIHLELRSVNNRDERYVWDKIGAGDSARETVIRYGWPSHTYWPGWVYERGFEKQVNAIAPIIQRPPPTFDGRSTGIRKSLISPTRPLRVLRGPLTTKEYSPDRTALLPDFKAIRDPFSLTQSQYSLTNPNPDEPDRWWPQEHLPLAFKLAVLDSGQTLLLRRDSTILYQLTIDDPLTTLDDNATGPSQAFLLGGNSERDTRELARAPIINDYTLRLSSTLSSTPIVLSAEIHARSENEPAHRLRFGLRPPPTLREMKATDVAMSDPIFLRLPNRNMPLPTDEVAIKRSAAGTLAFSQSEILALYWESYGLAVGDTVQIVLSIRRDDDRSALRRLASQLGVASPLRDSVSIRWTEPDGRYTTTPISGIVPVVGRTVSLDVNALAPGTYIAIVEMKKGTIPSLRSERRFSILESK